MSSSNSATCPICLENPAILECPYCDSEAICVNCLQADAQANLTRPSCFNIKCRQEYSLQYLIRRAGKDWCQNFLFDHLAKLSALEAEINLSNYNEAARKVQSSFQNPIFWTLEKRLRSSERILNQIEISIKEREILKRDQNFIDTIAKKEMEESVGISLENIQLLGYSVYYQHEVKTLNSKLSRMDKPISSIWEIEKLLDSSSKSKKQKDSVRVKCQSSDCPAYVRSEELCPSCGKFTCSRCMESTTDLAEHLCNPDTVKTVKSMKNMDGRNCPRCSIFIQKAWGCDQMFCLHCRAFFNYSTGRIYSRSIHNPEYDAFLQRGGKLDPSEEPSANLAEDCNVLPQFSARKVARLKMYKFYDLYPIVSEMQDYLRSERETIGNLELTKRAVNTMYLISMIKKETWQSYLAMLDIKKEYCQLKIDIMSHLEFLGICFYQELDRMDLQINMEISDKFQSLRWAMDDMVATFNSEILELTNCFPVYGETIEIKSEKVRYIYLRGYNFEDYYRELEKYYRDNYTVIALFDLITSRGINFKIGKVKKYLLKIAVMTHRQNENVSYPTPCTQPHAICLEGNAVDPHVLKVFFNSAHLKSDILPRSCFLLNNPVYLNISRYGLQ